MLFLAPLRLQLFERCADRDTEKVDGYCSVFIYLQLLDVLTTLVGFKLGAAEASPFIQC